MGSSYQEVGGLNDVAYTLYELSESDDLLALADARLYQAKASGRDQIAA